MAGYLMCFCSESGVPIFARKTGTLAPVPFALAAALNGVNVYGTASRVKLISSLTGSSRVVWEEFHERLTIIVAATDDCPCAIHLQNMLTNVFNVMVFMIGLEEILNNKNVDKLKREIRKCYPLIDLILQGVRPSEKTLHFGDLTMCVDVALQSQLTMNYQSIIDQAMDNLKCTYGCLIANGTVISSTKEWLSIPYSDRMFIVFYTGFVDTKCDSGVFLPVSSPRIPYRLVVFKISENVRLSILCDPELNIEIIEKEVNKIKRCKSENFVLFADYTYPFCNSSSLFSISNLITGFLFVNMKNRLVSWSIYPDHTRSASHYTVKKLNMLRTFYKNTVGTVFKRNYGDTLTHFISPCFRNSKDSEASEETIHNVQECYWASLQHKCYAIEMSLYQLFVIFEPSASIVKMKIDSRKLLHELGKDKAVKVY